MENTSDLAQDFILPDYKQVKRGFIRKEDTMVDENAQIVKVRNERFTVPEVIFSPSDIGINQAGLPEAIIQTVNKCPKLF
jgi:actin-related protein 6